MYQTKPCAAVLCVFLVALISVSCVSSHSIPRSQTVNLYGTRLDVDGAGSDVLISTCWCVHDSPENPCPCYGPTVRIPGAEVLQFDISDRQSTDGRPLSVATIANDARIIVGRDEAPVDAGRFVQETDVFAKIRGGLKGGGVRGTAGAILGAFLVGYDLGTKIDQATGASDALGDLLWDLLREN